MPSAILPTLSADDIDDLLYLARINELQDLKVSIEALAQAKNTSFSTILCAVIDPESGNGLLHMAAANNCMETLNYLLPSSTPSTSTQKLNIDLPNTSGNTPLHWAALNGHLDAVKLLLNAGADPAVTNQAGHDAVFEAEKSGKDEVVKWLLSESQGLEKGVGDGGREEEGEQQRGEEGQ